MKVLKRLFIATVVAACVSTASAQYIQTQNFSFTPNGNIDLNFNQWNVSAASVDTITITVVMNKTGGSLAVDNDSASSGTVTFDHTLSGALTSTDVNLNDLGFSQAWASTSLEAVSTTSQVLGATTGDPTVDSFDNTGDVDYFSFTPANTSDTESATIAPAVYTSGATGYLGTGTYVMNLNVVQLVNATGLGGLAQAFTPSQTSGSVTVELTVVPEPSAFALLAGLLAFTWIGLRRR